MNVIGRGGPTTRLKMHILLQSQKLQVATSVLTSCNSLLQQADISMCSLFEINIIFTFTREEGHPAYIFLTRSGWMGLDIPPALTICATFIQQDGVVPPNLSSFGKKLHIWSHWSQPYQASLATTICNLP